MTNTPKTEDLRQMEDWLRRAIFEILGGPMQDIKTHAMAEMKAGKVVVRLTATYMIER